MDLEFQRVLLKVQESLTGDEVQDLVFLCSDLLSLKDLCTVSSAGQLFSLLEKRNQLSCEDPSLLLELLRIMKQNSLIRNLTSDDYKQTNGTTYSQQISPYRQLLYERSESICEQDLQNIKFLLLKTLSRKKLEKDTPSALTLLSPVGIMEEQVDRLSLTEGPALISGDQCQNLDSNSVIENKSLNLSVTSQNTEIQQYEMKGDRRGFGLIINNYDFRACTLGNREGTDIDKERLEVVFKWLGFEVLVEQDCNRHQILQVLRNLAARDHTPADCVVCCVLSHGRVEGICGVDGEIVTFRELIETLSPNECPSLCKKPKLFFIQACRGNDNQPAAFPQTCSEDEDMLFSDAAVPRDSIPEMADYLLAMSTVPHYVSYREKGRGTWFIQSLCHSLQLLVPRGIDLLSILTQVNSDVSKKTDKSGLRKQMPQPEFTLTKRVVFPPPKSHRPLP
ncbi:caspase-8-like isoform X4 [Sinocyclocheilus anshuiensis]|uniref:caspase-8-like isoform X4 n=1 Tax=Sinocyclocheilus anshuiensis TaxID=1608454 RepID=UPI0007BA2331|nr:PREDICTED: caspase-8-like isoform X4 [Sinocyclocheilus anshuiensis]